jgi:hypothetical protein
MEERIRAVERWGLLSGVTGLVANGLLVGLYVSIGTGDQDFRWTGPANDVIGGIVSSSAGIPFVLALTDAVGGGPGLRTAARVAAVGQATIVGSSVLLVTDVLPFEVQVFVAIPAIATLFAWSAVLGRSGLLPRRLGRVALAIGTGFGVGLGLTGLSLLLPSESLAQYAVGGTGLALGSVAFLAYPIWQLRLSHTLRRHLHGPTRIHTSILTDRTGAAP